jgi:hypothetical protein
MRLVDACVGHEYSAQLLLAGGRPGPDVEVRRTLVVAVLTARPLHLVDRHITSLKTQEVSDLPTHTSPSGVVFTRKESMTESHLIVDRIRKPMTKSLILGEKAPMSSKTKVQLRQG